MLHPEAELKVPLARGHSAVRFAAVAAPVLAFVLFLLPGITPADQEERQLREIRDRIGSVRRDMRRDMERRDAESAGLRKSELLIAGVERNLAGIRAERRSSQARAEALAEEREHRARRLVAERERLGHQLRLAYVNGRQEQIKLVLNQTDPALIGRSMVYYGYLSRERAEHIATVAEHLGELARLETEVAGEAQRLTRLEERRTEERAALETAREERRRAMAALDARIAEQGTRIDQLQQRERALVALIEELQRVFDDYPMQADRPFAELRGALVWPLDGRVIADFGQARAGQRVRWNGVLLAAKRGTPVRAIANGRVAYADWLPGTGLIIVVEHGDGYMSLYGHNEALHKDVGDWVKPGEVLATVGDSGGQHQPALYFEIRNGRNPENPHPWFRDRRKGG